jgi:hypothetical protein
LLERFTTASDPNKEAERALVNLRDELQAHKDHEKSQSYLGTLFSSFNSSYGSSAAELQTAARNLEDAKKRGDKDALRRYTEQAEQLVEADRKTLNTQSEINHYAGSFAKGVGLFARGPWALAATVATYGLDQAKPGDTLSNQFKDGVLGSSKGLLMKGTFDYLGNKGLGVAAKGITMGVSSRFLDEALTRQTYIKDGEFNLSHGLKRVGGSTLNVENAVADAVLFTVAHGTVGKLNSVTANAIERSPFLKNMATGTTFGASSGAMGELVRQHDAGEKLDLSKVFMRAGLQATVDGLAAAPGGIQADAGMRRAINNYGSETIRNTRVEAGKTIGLMSEFSQWLINGGNQPQFAFAMAGNSSGGRYNARPIEAWMPAKGDNLVMMAATHTAGAGSEKTVSTSRPVVEAGAEKVVVPRPLVDAKPVAPETSKLTQALDQVQSALAQTAQQPEHVRAEQLTKIQEFMFRVERLPVKTAENAQQLLEVDRALNRQLMAMSKIAAEKQKEYDRLKPELNEEQMDRWFAPQQAIEDVVGARLKNAYLWNGKDRGSYDRSASFSMKEGVGLQGRVFGGVAELLNKNMPANEHVLAELAKYGMTRERALRWVGLGMPDKSAADLVGADYLLIHRPSGEYYPLDLTLRAEGITEGRTVDSRLTNRSLYWGEKRIPVERENWVIATVNENVWENMMDRAQRGTKMGLVEANNVVKAELHRDLGRVLGATLAKPSGLNIFEVQLPSADPTLPVSRKIYEMWRFKQQLQGQRMYDWVGATNSSIGFLLKTDAQAASLPWRDLIFGRAVADASRNGNFRRGFQ